MFTYIHSVEIKKNAYKKKHNSYYIVNTLIDDKLVSLFFFFCSIYGKSLESLRRHCCIKLLTDERKLKKYVGKPSFKRVQIFHEYLVGVENLKVNVFLHNPLYLGQTILDLSKHSMYEFHYKVIKPMYGENIKLLFTDTGKHIYNYI